MKWRCYVWSVIGGGLMTWIIHGSLLDFCLILSGILTVVYFDLANKVLQSDELKKDWVIGKAMMKFIERRLGSK